MAAGIKKEFILTGTKNMAVRVTVTEEYDLLGNTSDVTVAVEVASTVSSSRVHYLSGTVAVDGTVLVSMNAGLGYHKVYVEGKDTYYPITASGGYAGSPWTHTGIGHNNDGTKTITVSVSIKGDNGWTANGNLTVELQQIPRSSEIGATDANIGATSMIAVNKKNGAYTHSIAYQFGSLSGYIAADGSASDTEVKMDSASIAFQVPVSFYNQIPNAPSAACTLTCRTYNGSTQIGDAKSCTFVATADERTCAPTVSGTVVDVNEATIALTGDPKTLVRYMSTALCTITAEAKNGASIASKSIEGEFVSGDSREVTGFADNTFSFVVTDSRGYETRGITWVKNLVLYKHLTLNISAQRENPTSSKAVLKIAGEAFGGFFGAAMNALTLQYRINNGAWIQVETAISAGAYSTDVELTDLTYTQSFSVAVQAQDLLQTVSRTITIGKGIPVFDWGENDFVFHVPVQFCGGINTEIGTDDGTEWMYPPMDVGIEYRTMERWNGKTVYTALLDFGETQYTISTKKYETTPTNIIRHAGVMGAMALPYIFNNSLTDASSVFYNVYISDEKLTVTLYCGSNRIGRQTYIQVWYTKD